MAPTKAQGQSDAARTSEAAKAARSGNSDSNVMSRSRIGSRLREARVRAKLGVRELARQLEISASLVSQIELGRVVPSVSTLYMLATALDISMDSLFADDAAAAGAIGSTVADSACWTGAAPIDGPLHEGTEPRDRSSYVQRRRRRRAIDLEQGIRWELLTPSAESGSEFLEVYYPVGGSSSTPDHAIRHNGRDYCLILEGVLSVEIGFEQYTLHPGDSIAFEATIPHRLWNAGSIPVRAVWFVLDRRTTRP